MPPAHLVADPASATANDLSLGLPGRNTTLHLLTSPNAGGKSTLLKTLGTAVVTSRALGLALGRRFVWRRPVGHLDTLLQLRDEGGKASLYQAELHRVARVVERLGAADDADPTLVLIDEMFNTTNARRRPRRPASCAGPWRTGTAPTAASWSAPTCTAWPAWRRPRAAAPGA